MAKNQTRGQIGSDGQIRYYNRSQHAWQTSYEIERDQKAQKIVNTMTTVAAVILGGGGFLWMLIMTFGG
ncbi:hypothetical protein A9199_06940 [Donghicola sp. JL3646]|nr:hypothetical protein BSK21_01600 [Marivivens sp. JLT3646]OBR37058.1 hypothetical protein A9199_06940 [Donghicola sp. JL3646]